MEFKRKSRRVYTAALLMTTSLAVPTTGRAQAVTSSSNAEVLAKVRVDNFGQVGPSYYRGGQPNGRDYADLASLGVKTIVNLTSDDSDASEPQMVERAGLQYVHIPMTTRQAPTAEQLAEFLKVVTEPANQPVYVHCVGGRHRTGVMTAAYRMAHDGWTADKAFAEMKRYKFGADMFHPEFKAFVYAYRADATAAPSAVTVAGSKTGGK